MKFVGSSDSARMAAPEIKVKQPDVALIDIGLKDGDGLVLTEQLREMFPDLKMIVLSMHDETLYAERALLAGANGYVMKEEPGAVLVEAIRRVADNDVFVSSEMRRRLLKGYSRHGKLGGDRLASLTDRQIEILRMIGQGHDTAEIAASLGLSKKTVEYHRVQMKERLNISKLSELVRMAVRWVEDM
ncbi:MAG: response regulator transcription factor [Verrucomicrobia bacterium]|nr:response regulator transcription factor [Verrucomicrobiota bacterium]